MFRTPLTGILFIIVLVISFVIMGEPPDADEPVQEIVDHYVDNKDEIAVGSLLAGPGVILFLFFANHLRSLFRHAAPGSELPTMILVGAIVLASGVLFDATLSFAMTEAVEDVEPESIHTMQAIWDNDFVPMAAGMSTLLIATGLCTLRYGVLPKWLGWVAIALGIVTFTPAGFVGFIGSLVFVLIVSVLLFMRSDAGRPAAPAAPTPPPAGAA